MPAERLDVRLARQTGLTRSRVERLIREGRATVDGRVEKKPGYRLSEAETAAVDIPPPAEMEAAPENIPLSIVYEDAYLAVVNKPCGMVVHPAAGNETGTLVNALLFHLRASLKTSCNIRPNMI